MLKIICKYKPGPLGKEPQGPLNLKQVGSPKSEIFKPPLCLGLKTHICEWTGAMLCIMTRSIIVLHKTRRLATPLFGVKVGRVCIFFE